MVRIWKADPVTDVNNIHIFEVIPVIDACEGDYSTIAYWIHNEFVRGNKVHLVPCFMSIFLCTNEYTQRLEEKYFGTESRIVVRLNDDIQLYIVEQV